MTANEWEDLSALLLEEHEGLMDKAGVKKSAEELTIYFTAARVMLSLSHVTSRMEINARTEESNK